MWPVLLLTLLATILISTPSEGANILGLYTGYTPSHLILHMSVAKALAEAGHNVTVVSVLEPKVKCKDIHMIVIPVKDEHEKIIENQLKLMATRKNTLFDTLNHLLNELKVMVDSQYELLSHPTFQQIYETKFDLMILGWFVNDFQLGVAAKLRVPVIVHNVIRPSAVNDAMVGNPTEVSYVPNLMNPVAKGEVMGFGKRLKNFATYWFFIYSRREFNKRFNAYYNEHFGVKSDFPTLSEMKRNISLLFATCHLISEGPIRPLVPAIVQIGGIQIKDTPDPLPKDIEEFLSNSKQGAILFSLGSNIKSSSVKPKIIQMIFKVLSSLKQNVIWKWEDLDNLPGKSANILYKKWLPQPDVLAHPNTKLFITHAGQGSITEAQYHAVPMVALPVFADQPGNAIKMQNSGYGLSLDLLTITEETFSAAIHEVLENEKYAQTIGQFSTLYRDRPLTARQEVIYWVDYVLRHRGAPHLQSPLVHMGTIAAYNLDIYALLLAISIVTFLLARLLLKFILGKLLSRLFNSNVTKKFKIK